MAIRYYPHSETLNAQLRLSDFDGDALRQAAHLPAVAVGGDGNAMARAIHRSVQDTFGRLSIEEQLEADREAYELKLKF